MGICGSKGGGAASQPAQKAQASENPASKMKEGGFNRSNFILDSKGSLVESYTVDKKTLGEGSYGTVSKATHKVTNAIRAVKTIGKKQMKNPERFRAEIAIMKVMDHPNIVKLYETFEDVRNIYLVMELCSGGELFDRIIKHGHFTESQAATVMTQILRAIYYMHSQGVMHRDLKPENFLFSSTDDIEKALLKIIDFGLSCYFKPGDMKTTKAGTPYYVAPQVLEGRYNQACDVWSCGVIQYIILCGYPPFYGENDADVLAKVKVGKCQFPPADWKNVTVDAVDLIRKMLTLDPKTRISAEAALNHVWIQKKAPAAANINLKEGNEMMKHLQQFTQINKLKKAALNVIASQLDEGAIKGLREMFLSLDANGDGTITVAEMKEGMKKMGITDMLPDLKGMLEQVDSDGSGNIDYTEFLAATLDKKKYMQESILWNAFKTFDLDGDGKITQKELAQILGSGSADDAMGAKAVQAMIQEVDANGDGVIDFEEFVAMMREKATTGGPAAGMETGER